LDFKLFPYRVPVKRDRAGRIVYRYIQRPMHVELYALSFAAGHERFINAPTWQLQCKVSNDFLQAQRTIQGYKNDNLRGKYLQVFGGFYKRPKDKGDYLAQPIVVDAETRDSWLDDVNNFIEDIGL
jgi:hypothetical protein